MTKRLLIECEKCGEGFIFTSSHKHKADVESDLDWAMQHVTLCHRCRPDYRWMQVMSSGQIRSGAGGTDFI